MLKKWFGKKDEEPSSADETRQDASGATPAAGGDSPGAGQKKSRWSFLRLGFSKTRKGLRSLFGMRGQLDEETLDDIESELYGADFGPTMVQELIDGEQGLRSAWKAGKIDRKEEVLDYLKDRLKEMLATREAALMVSDEGPTVILVAGVNGTGKTTSIAKLAHMFQESGSSVLLVAGDTFRAAAVEQLTIWSERLGIEIVTGKPKADPASVAYTGLQRALDRGVDVVIVDTAGRLHTDKNLMRELQKIRNVLSKKVDGAPHESLLVLDSTNGQNAIQQAEAFKRDIEVTGIILTKLDGTAKGGVVFAIHQKLEIPVKFVGLGEKVENLAVFDPTAFVDALFDEARQP